LVSVERAFGGSEPTSRKSSQAARLEADAPAQPREAAKARRQAIPDQIQKARSRRESLHQALEAARAENRVQSQRLAEARAQLQAIAEWIETGRAQREVLRESAVTRLRARLESLPVIEQAKGILMVQHRCGPEEAFDLLRRASQRANVKVHVLAAQIVANVASTPAEAPPRPAASRRP